jgi:hypothetical protein
MPVVLDVTPFPLLAPAGAAYLRTQAGDGWQ